MKDELVCENGEFIKGHRLAVPKECRKDIPKHLHSSHVDIEATKRRAHDTVLKKTTEATYLTDTSQKELFEAPVNAL